MQTHFVSRFNSIINIKYLARGRLSSDSISSKKEITLRAKTWSSEPFREAYFDPGKANDSRIFSVRWIPEWVKKGT